METKFYKVTTQPAPGINDDTIFNNFKKAAEFFEGLTDEMMDKLNLFSKSIYECEFVDGVLKNKTRLAYIVR